MPMYCYTTKEGDVTVTRVSSIERRRKKIKLPDGRWAYRDYVAEHRGYGGPISGWPLHSDAMGVHPKQRRSVMKFCADHGVPTYFDSEGRPVLTSRGHRKAHMAIRGCYDADGGYGDAAPGQSLSSTELDAPSVEYI